uniref:Retrotransposon gag domain-containing protein n=1 Tax=Cajanus cajan TaxID=3821 RepID=A0A151SHD9_CAJCA|nr:hypothetical protein KK1_000340 [Cajanus cajan]
MQVEQLFSCHGVSEERKVSLATLSFQGYVMYWWTSLEKERIINHEHPIQYWNELRSALRRRHIPPYYDRELMDKNLTRKQSMMALTNKISFQHLGKKFMWCPLSPFQMNENQLK